MRKRMKVPPWKTRSERYVADELSKLASTDAITVGNPLVTVETSRVTAAQRNAVDHER